MRRVVVPPPVVELRPDAGSPVTRIAGDTMGTTWSAVFTHLTLPADVATAAVQAALDAVVAQMSPWEPASDLCRFNAAATGEWVSLPEDLLTVVDIGLKVAAATGGAFDPTLGALVDLWGFGPAAFSGAPPSPAEVAAAAAVSGWRRLRRDGERLLQPGGLRLDLGGVAKGFGVDQAVSALQALGVRNALVEVGGELKGIGAKPDGSPWWVSLEAAPASGGGEALVALSGWAVATSADHRRRFVHAGRTFGHTLDRRHGSAQTGRRSLRHRRPRQLRLRRRLGDGRSGPAAGSDAGVRHGKRPGPGGRDDRRPGAVAAPAAMDRLT